MQVATVYSRPNDVVRIRFLAPEVAWLKAHMAAKTNPKFEVIEGTLATGLVVGFAPQGHSLYRLTDGPGLEASVNARLVGGIIEERRWMDVKPQQFVEGGRNYLRLPPLPEIGEVKEEIVMEEKMPLRAAGGGGSSHAGPSMPFNPALEGVTRELQPRKTREEILSTVARHMGPAAVATATKERLHLAVVSTLEKEGEQDFATPATAPARTRQRPVPPQPPAPAPAPVLASVAPPQEEPPSAPPPTPSPTDMLRGAVMDRLLTAETDLPAAPPPSDLRDRMRSAFAAIETTPEVRISQVREAIGILNNELDGLDDVVRLRIEDNRIRASRVRYVEEQL